MSATPAVAWREVCKSYPDGHQALRGVSLEVAAGECLAVLGTSGSGKTTLLKMVNRLIEPTSGDGPGARRADVGVGADRAPAIDRLRHPRRRADAAPRHPGQRRPGPPGPGAAPGGVRRGGARSPGAGRARPVAVRAAEAASAQRRPAAAGRGRPSPGRRPRPDPDGRALRALDPITRRELQDEFRRLQRRLGKTVVFVTHDIREACRIADRLALVAHGRLVQHGRAADLLERPADDFVRSFFREAEAIVAVTEEEEG